jgi:hypothetical protein
MGIMEGTPDNHDIKQTQEFYHNAISFLIITVLSLIGIIYFLIRLVFIEWNQPYEEHGMTSMICFLMLLPIALISIVLYIAYRKFIKDIRLRIIGDISITILLLISYYIYIIPDGDIIPFP